MRRIAIVIPACLVLACGGSAPPSEVPQVPDTLFLDPVDTVGVESGDSNYVFAMIWQARIDALGRLLVLDNQVCNVRAYSADGTWLATAGGRGSGPGELQFPIGMASLSDGGIAIVDPLSGSVALYDSGLVYERSLTGFFPAPPMRLAGADSGSFVALQPTYSEDGGTGVIRTVCGRWRDSTDPELVFQSTDMPVESGEGLRLQGPEYVLDGSPDGRVAIALSSPDLYRIECFGRDGLALFTIEEDWEPVAKTEEELAAGISTVAISIENGNASAETRTVEDTEPYHVAISDVFFGPDGELWVRIGGGSIPTFRRYDREGTPLGVALIPALDSSSGGSWDVSVSPYGVAAWDMDPEAYPSVVRLVARN